MHQLPVKSGVYDLAVCSLALHLTALKTRSQEENVHERELAFRELNRVLRPNGIVLATLPKDIITEGDLPKTYESLTQLGYEILPLSGFYKSPDSDFKVYLLAAQKVMEPQDEPLDRDAFAWKMDAPKKKKISRGKARKGGMRQKKEIIPRILTTFIITKNGKSMQELAAERIAA